MVRYFHWEASLAGVAFFGCGVLSLAALAYFAPRVTEPLGDMHLPGLPQVMFSRIPSCLAVAVGAALSVLCLAHKTKLSLASVALFWLFSCLRMLSTIVSIVLPVMVLQDAQR